MKHSPLENWRDMSFKWYDALNPVSQLLFVRPGGRGEIQSRTKQSRRGRTPDEWKRGTIQPYGEEGERKLPGQIKRGAEEIKKSSTSNNSAKASGGSWYQSR
jgi:hypothetical protein